MPDLSKRPMMKCGHAANAVDRGGKPCCVICVGIHSGAEEIDDNPPSLTERMAECPYCSRKRASSADLAFFEHRPNRVTDSFYCGCRGWD